jgi:hypothetical protein
MLYLKQASFGWATEQEFKAKGEIGIKTNFAIPRSHERVHTSNEGLGAILSWEETGKDLPIA